MYATITSWRYMAPEERVDRSPSGSKPDVQAARLLGYIYLPAELAHWAAVKFLIVPVALIDRLAALGADEKTILPINKSAVFVPEIPRNFFPVSHFVYPFQPNITSVTRKPSAIISCRASSASSRR